MTLTVKRLSKVVIFVISFLHSTNSVVLRDRTKLESRLNKLYAFVSVGDDRKFVHVKFFRKLVRKVQKAWPLPPRAPTDESVRLR